MDDESWRQEMLASHKPELLELAGPYFVDWEIDHERVTEAAKARQMVRRVAAQLALRAADPRAAAAHPNASFLELWESLPAGRQEGIRQAAETVEAEIEWYRGALAAIELPTLAQEDAFAVKSRRRLEAERLEALPPHMEPLRRMLQAAVAQAATTAGLPGAQRCSLAAERLSAASAALPGQQRELLRELEAELRDRSLELAPALDATLAAEAQPHPDRRADMEDSAAGMAAAVPGLAAKYGPALQAVWEQLSGHMGAPPG